MPRKLTAVMSLDEIEDEILYTRAALRADPDAASLVSASSTWLGSVDAVRAQARTAREAVADADALRAVANARLDNACTDFGDDLLRAVDKDRTSARWLKFFRGPVSTFIRQRLGEQVSTVQAWLGTDEAALGTHRPLLQKWSDAASRALVTTRGTALVRGTALQGREELAENLTRSRDALHAALVTVAADHHLSRDWADLFFRTTPHRTAADAPTAATPASPSAAT